MNIKNKVVSGVKWTTIQFAIDAIFKFGIKLFLAKILFPDQFGLIGMASIFIALAIAASEFGVGDALIQRKEQNEAELLYPTAFWTGIGWGLVLFLIMTFAVGPFAAFFYKEPILLRIIPVLSLSILFKPLSLIPTVILTRVMDFKKMAKILNFSSFFAGIISIVAAYLNFGVWALVINSVLATVVSIPFFYFATTWMPRMEWNMAHFRTIFRFGAYSTLTRVFSTFTYNIDNLMIGKMLGPTLLGSYTLSFSLTEQLRQVMSSVLNKVMYPIFGKLQDEREKLKLYFLKVVNLNSLVIYPLMTFFLIFGDNVILIFFGQKWDDAIIPLKILAVSMMVHLIVNSFTSLIRGIGKPELEMKIVVLLTVFVFVPSLYFGIKMYGLTGATFAILVNKIFLTFVGLLVLNRELQLKLWDIVLALKSALIGCCVSSFLIFFLQILFKTDNFYLLSIFFIFSYIGLIAVLERSSLYSIYKLIN